MIYTSQNENNYWDYLSHHGVKGMEWGIMNGPPYPLDKAGRAALRAQKKIAKKTGDKVKLAVIRAKLKEDRRAIKQQKKDDKAKAERNKELKRRLELARQAKIKKESEEKAAAERKAEFESKKQKAIKTGDFKYAEQYRDYLSDDELNSLLNRVNLNQRLEDARVAQKTAKYDNINKRITQATNAATSAVNAYNLAVKVHNSLFPDQKPWTKIAEGPQIQKDGISNINYTKDANGTILSEVVVEYKDGIRYTTTTNKNSNASQKNTKNESVTKNDSSSAKESKSDFGEIYKTINKMKSSKSSDDEDDIVEKIKTAVSPSARREADYAKWQNDPIKKYASQNPYKGSDSKATNTAKSIIADLRETYKDKSADTQLTALSTNWTNYMDSLNKKGLTNAQITDYKNASDIIMKEIDELAQKAENERKRKDKENGF